MFTEYTVEAWRLFGGWVLFAIAALVGAVGWRMAYILNKSNGAANKRAMKAECEAREASAAHEEAVRKLNAFTLVAAEMETELNRLTPKRRKDGKFAPKSGKTGEKKKVKKGAAKPNRIG